MNFLTTTLPLRAYSFTFVVFVTVVIYVPNSFSVGNYSLKCSHFSWNNCDLSRDNVPNASRSNAERNGKRTGDERLGKPFETGTVNGWTAN